MKLLLLADANSPHIIRWAKSLHKKDIRITIFTLHLPDLSLYSDTPEIKILSFNLSEEYKSGKIGTSSKFIYLKAVKLVKKIIRELEPNILHSHYASSYGLIGALSGFHPYIISVWGADVYNFPTQSYIYNALLKFSLRKADTILSTSRVMGLETKKYVNKDIIVTPFGIDVDLFAPKEVDSIFNNDELIIGTIKSLKKKYGIEYLIRAFEIVKKKYSHIRMKLLIVGTGIEETNLKNLVSRLKLENDTVFTGYIDPDKVHDYHNMLNISVSVSIDNSESFGVAVLEASACGKPVIVSKVGGLPEVVEDGVTGVVVNPMDVDALVDALCLMIENPEMRIRMGNNGRMRVLQSYNWKDSVNQMVSIYQSLTQKFNWYDTRRTVL